MKKLNDETLNKVMKIIRTDNGWNWSSIQDQTKIGAGNGSRLFWLLVGIGIIKYLPINQLINGKRIYPRLHPITQKGKTFDFTKGE